MTEQELAVADKTPTHEGVQRAMAKIAAILPKTPLLPLEVDGVTIWCKAEMLQPIGAFKIRGAWHRLSDLNAEERARGVVGVSSGNHAQGVALAAREHGAPAVIVMPSDAPAVKIANTRALGATVVLYDRATEDRDEIGARLSAEQGLTLIKPFDEPLVIAGQGTTGLEIAEDMNALGITDADVMVCCGGGGLTSGIALALAADAPGLRVRPAEPEDFDDVTRALISGKIESNVRHDGSLCDAIITPQPGNLTFPIMQKHCGPGVVVSEDECMRAVALAFDRLRIVVEPGGAAALAAALFHPDEFTGDAVIAVATGGNIDAPVFAKALETLR